MVQRVFTELNSFNAKFYNAHKPIYLVIESLTEIQAETNIKISTKIYAKLFQLTISKKLIM